MSEHTDRITVRVPTDQLGVVDDLVDDGAFDSRSDAVRSALEGLTDEHGCTAIDANGQRVRLVADGGDAE